MFTYKCRNIQKYIFTIQKFLVLSFALVKIAIAIFYFSLYFNMQLFVKKKGVVFPQLHNHAAS